MASIKNLLFTVSLAVAAGSATANAQTPSKVSTQVRSANTVTDSSAAGPRIAPSGVTRTAFTSATAFRSQPQSMGRPMALMIVGGSAFVLGALIGSEVGTLFMLGGAISFLIGLYEYIR